MATLNELKSVKRRHARALLKQQGVCGVDIDADADGLPIIAVHLDTDDPSVRQRLPDELEGNPLKFIYTGPIRKQDARSS